ncbi:hypothetical protein GCM10009618_16430 [Nesterenkonia lacusekhoensis]
MVKTRRQDRQKKQAYFLHGDSGNVKSSIDEVQQHKVGVLGDKRRKRVFNHAAREAMAEKDLDSADFFSKKVFELAPDDPRPFHQYTSFLIKTKQWAKLAAQVQARRNDPYYGEVAERAEFLGVLARREWEEADRLVAEAIRTKSPNADMMKSRKVRAELDKRALERGITLDQRVKLWWMETPYPGNFGDAINPYIVEGLTGIPPKFSTKPHRTLAIGSIIKFAKPGTKVWGAGNPRQEEKLDPAADYRAVRGPLTRDLVLRNGGHMDEVYGDPAWFLPKIYHPTVKKTHKLGILLHVNHRGAVKNVDPDVKIIDLRRVGPEEIEAFIRELLSCEAVLSTSLHGVIVAHAYGIPVRWCTVSKARKGIPGDGMKFEDYFQSVGRSAPEPLDLSGLERVTSDLAEQCVDNAARPINLKKLADAAPFDVALEL